MTGELTAFSWGYWGWGNATRELIRAFDAVERARGYGPPLFADVRISRGVRAIGFRDDSFERTVGRDRYRWLRGLGNAAVATGQGRLRLQSPESAFELLGLILAQSRAGRRVVFFCSCESPWKAGWCHRRKVAAVLSEAAKTIGLRLKVEEWPGGVPKRGGARSIAVPDRTLRTLQAGGRWVPLGRRQPATAILGLAVGSIVSLGEGRRVLGVAVCPPRLVKREWKMELFAPLARSRGNTLKRVAGKRRALGLEPRR